MLTKKQNARLRHFLYMVSALSTLMLLYVFARFDAIVAYTRPFALPTIKLILMHLGIIITSYICFFRLFRASFSFTIKKQLVFLLCTTIGSLFAYYTLTSWNHELYGNISLYILLRNYLRDFHAINWFFMDYEGWLLSGVLYLGLIFTTVIYELVLRILHKDS